MGEMTIQDLKNEIDAELFRLGDEIDNCQKHDDYHGEDMARASVATLKYIIRIVDGDEL